MNADHATSGPIHILIDFENVQPKDIQLLKGHDYRILVFVGANQTKVPVRLAAALQNLGANASYMQISGSGRNALDFHIAYYVGKLVSQDPSASIVIISRDTGFDPLIKHLRENRIGAARYGDLAKIPALGMKSAKSMDDRLARIVRNLTDQGHSRPGKVSTLSNTINSLFSKSLDEEEVRDIIGKLVARGFLVIEQERVSYKLNREASQGGGDAPRP